MSNITKEETETLEKASNDQEWDAANYYDATGTFVKGEPELSAKEILNQLHKHRVTKGIGIYFLYHNDEIIYVGQSRNIGHRVYTHLAEGVKVFNYCATYECDHLSQKEIDCLEAEFIIELAPKHNESVPTNGKFKSLGGIQNSLLKSGIKITRWKLKKLIRMNNIVPVGKHKMFYRMSDFEEVIL